MDAIPLSATDKDGNVLTLHIDPGQASVETLADLLIALSNMHIACGGSSLNFKVIDPTETTQPPP